MERTRIMYIERKAGELTGSARIGRVRFSKSRQSIYYNGLRFETLKGTGFKANYFETESGEEYWISGCKKNGQDRLYGENIPVEIDEDVRHEYWTEIRNLPEQKNLEIAN
ncbi:MAG: mannose-1-phosphate guanylyltransferase [Algibacter sp.]